MTPEPPAPDARQIAEQITREAIAHDSACRADDENGCDCGYAGAVGRTIDAIARALAEATATAEAERDELRKLKAEILDNPEKWMRWCDSRVLERAEVVEAQLTEARRAVWEEAASHIERTIGHPKLEQAMRYLVQDMRHRATEDGPS